MGKTISTKNWPGGRTQPDAVVAGIYYCEKGTCLEESALDDMKHILTEYKPKVVVDAQHVHGCVQYMHSAFDFNQNDRT